jgi:hypothetical protein
MHKKYTAFIQLEPGNSTFGGSWADIQLSQVRLWLLGTDVVKDELNRRRYHAHGERIYPGLLTRSIETEGLAAVPVE